MQYHWTATGYVHFISLSGELKSKGRNLVYALGKENFKTDVLGGLSYYNSSALSSFLEMGKRMVVRLPTDSMVCSAILD